MPDRPARWAVLGEAEPRVELVELEAGHGVDVAVATTVFSAGGRVSDPRYWNMMARTRRGNRQSVPAASGWSALGTVTAYAAAIVAFAYALMSLYWALGGHGLVSTIGGYVEQFTRRGGILPVVIALAATLAKVAGGLLALAMVRPWGRAVPRRWLLAGSAVASALLVVYGGLNVLLGALVLSGVIHPTGSVDRKALRWHVGVWDLWFLVWGILLALAAVGYWRRTVRGLPRDEAANRVSG
jgi:Protein of unknown function (DUF3995)